MKKTHSIEMEVKFASDEDQALGKLTGYGARYGNQDFANDIVAQGAFKKSLSDRAAKGKKFPFLYQHDQTRPIGVIDKITEDENGLLIDVQLNMEVQDAREAAALIKQGAINGLSIGFDIIKADMDAKGVRVIKEARLWEVSAVTFPCNEQAVIDSIKSQFEDNATEHLEVAEEATTEESPMAEPKIKDLVNSIRDRVKDSLNKSDWDLLLSSLDSLVDEEDLDVEEVADEVTDGDTSADVEGTDAQAESSADAQDEDEPQDQDKAEGDELSEEDEAALLKFMHSLETFNTKGQ